MTVRMSSLPEIAAGVGQRDKIFKNITSRSLQGECPPVPLCYDPATWRGRGRDLGTGAPHSLDVFQIELQSWPGHGKQTNNKFLTWSLTSGHQPRV